MLARKQMSLQEVADEGLMQQIMQRITQLDYARLPERQQRRWMSLCDVFSTPPTKNPFNIWRSNAYGKDTHERREGNEEDDNDMGGYLYELLCRANHSCEPSVEKNIDRETGVVAVVALRNIAKGDKLCTSYLPEQMNRPTNERRALLQEKYRFICTCERCGPIKEDPADVN